MSLEDHPNIHAVGFSVDITTSLRKHLRGKALENLEKKELAIGDEKITNLIVDFVADISTRLDEIVEERKWKEKIK